MDRPTPRTDSLAATWRLITCGNVALGLCRQLERENAEQAERIAALEKELAQMMTKYVQPCCQEWHTCQRPCVPLAENWRMAAKDAERRLAEVAAALQWCVEHDGECLGDWPARLQIAKSVLGLIAEPVNTTKEKS